MHGFLQNNRQLGESANNRPRSSYLSPCIFSSMSIEKSAAASVSRHPDCSFWQSAERATPWIPESNPARASASRCRIVRSGRFGCRRIGAKNRDCPCSRSKRDCPLLLVRGHAREDAAGTVVSGVGNERLFGTQETACEQRRDTGEVGVGPDDQVSHLPGRPHETAVHGKHRVCPLSEDRFASPSPF